MASQKAIAEIIATIKTIFPYYEKNIDAKSIAKIWSTVLKDYSDEEVNNALLECMKECTYPPAPADLVRHIRRSQAAALPSAEELWGIYHDMLVKGSRLYSCFNYTAMDDNGKTQGQNARQKAEKLWQEAPEDIRRYIGSHGEFIRRAGDFYYNNGDLGYEHRSFIRTISQKRENDIRSGYISALPEDDSTRLIPEII